MTGAVEHHFVAGDLPAGLFLDFLVERLVYREIYIQHASAAFTHEVYVRCGVAVVPLLPVDCADPDDGPVLEEGGDVSVDRCKAEVGE